MATTKIWDVRGWLGHVVNYAENPDKTGNLQFSEADLQGLRDVMNYATQDYKTEHQYFVSGINCMPETAREEMQMVKKKYGKEGGIVAFHAYQSFKPGEVTPELAHEIGKKLAQNLWGDRFQVVVATHLDKEHIHSHFVLSSVSFVDGKRYNDCKASYARMRRESDRLCQEYKLSVIENPGTHTPRTIYLAEKEGKPTRYNVIRADIDEIISRSMTFTQFKTAMKAKGYILNFSKTRKYWTVQAPGAERPTRLKTLGENYAEEAINDRILQNSRPQMALPLPEPERKHYQMKGSIKIAKRIGGLQGLYLHYCYLLGILPKKNSRRPTHPLLKMELLRMNDYMRQTKLLCRYRIDTEEQLVSFLDDLNREKSTLVQERTGIQSKLRRSPGNSALKERRAEINGRLKEIRAQGRNAQAILERSSQVKNNIRIVQEDRIQQSHQKKRGRKEQALS